MNTYIPEGYKSLLGVYDTQKAIGLLKRLFEDQLAANLNLFRVSAPLFLEESSGLNDNLNGYERPVRFDIPDVGTEAQVVHSLAKWKRLALKRYEFNVGKGLFTDMNAIRRVPRTAQLTIPRTFSARRRISPSPASSTVKPLRRHSATSIPLVRRSAPKTPTPPAMRRSSG